MIIEPSARGASEVRRLWLKGLRVRESADSFVSTLAAHRTRKAEGGEGSVAKEAVKFAEVDAARQANPECMKNEESKGRFGVIETHRGPVEG